MRPAGRDKEKQLGAQGQGRRLDPVRVLPRSTEGGGREGMQESRGKGGLGHCLPELIPQPLSMEGEGLCVLRGAVGKAMIAFCFSLQLKGRRIP